MPRPNTGPPHVGVDGNWQCQQCQNANWAKREKCNRCQAERTPEQDAIAKEVLQRIDGQQGHSQQPVQGWNCPQCSNLNYSFRTQCNRCKADRPNEAAEE
eukprot:EC715062.1.p2 GENE.EC715062.1~~EC715062.1.p2  ORF type:complete len:100 (+),score=18.37 EC715062.1:3-302(+)